MPAAETEAAREKRARITFLGLDRQPVCEFDRYRDVDTRLGMVEFVMGLRRLSSQKVVDDLRKLNAIGLAYLYRDMLATTESVRVLADYDASAWSGR